MKSDKKEKLRLLVELYKEEFDRTVKRVSYRAGSMHNGEDVTQEAFSRAIKYIDSFEPEATTIAAWFNTILNRSLKDFRSEERRQGMAQTPDRIVEDLTEEVHKQELLKSLLDDIEKMYDPTKSILQMYVVLGYTAKEIARVLDVGVFAVRQTVKRYLASVRERHA